MKSRAFPTLVLLLPALVLSSGCGQKRQGQPVQSMDLMEAPLSPSPVPPAMAPTPSKMAPSAAPMESKKTMQKAKELSPSSLARSGDLSLLHQNAHPRADLKLVKTAQMALEVESFNEAMEALEKLTLSLGGYLGQSQISREADGRQRGQFTLRLPNATFDQVGGQARRLGKLLSYQQQVQDESRQMADLEIRIQAKREAVERLKELHRTRTGSIQGILEVQQILAGTIESLEQLQGELAYLKNRVDFSTLVVDLQEKPRPVQVVAIPKPGFWKPVAESFQSSLQNLKDFGRGVLILLVGLVPWLPLLAGFGFAAVAFLRWFLRQTSPTKTAPATIASKPQASESRNSSEE